VVIRRVAIAMVKEGILITSSSVQLILSFYKNGKSLDGVKYWAQLTRCSATNLSPMFTVHTSVGASEKESWSGMQPLSHARRSPTNEIGGDTLCGMESCWSNWRMPRELPTIGIPLSSNRTSLQPPKADDLEPPKVCVP
jgi:hypothetical protein